MLLDARSVSKAFADISAERTSFPLSEGIAVYFGLLPKQQNSLTLTVGPDRNRFYFETTYDLLGSHACPQTDYDFCCGLVLVRCGIYVRANL